MKIELKRGWDWITTAEKGSQLLRLFNLDSSKDDLTANSLQGFLAFIHYRPPNKELFKNQEITLIAKEPISDQTYKITLGDGDLIEEMNKKISEMVLSNEIKVTKNSQQITVTLRPNVNIEFNRNSCPRLMGALNIIDDSFILRGEQSKRQFPYTQPTASFKNETFRAIIYKIFPTTRKENRSSTFKISGGMYKHAKDLFKEFRYTVLHLLPDSKVGYTFPVVLSLRLQKN